MKISLAYWTHNYFGPKWALEDMCKICVDLGIQGIELVPTKLWDVLAKYNLQCPMAILDFGDDGPKPFDIGWNSRSNWDQVGTETLRLIEACKASNGLCNAVIAFSGMRIRGQKDSDARSNCVRGMMQTGVIRAAEEAGVNLSFEVLNDKIDIPMRGHPGYDATTMDYAHDICMGAQSERLGVLFDIYHRQVMEGNVAEGIRRMKPIINHVHVAGIGPLMPRGEMNVGSQELDHRGIGFIIRETLSPDVWIGIEMLPTNGRDHIGDIRASKSLLCGV